MKKVITQEQVDRAAKRVLSAAKKYGNTAAVQDYSDKEDGAFLEAGYKYAEILRARGKVVRQLYCIQRNQGRGNRLLDHLVSDLSGLHFAYGPVDSVVSLVLLDKAAAESIAKVIGNCQAVPYTPPV